jgi:uncharacterized phage protein (TIGR02218 family)
MRTPIFESSPGALSALLNTATQIVIQDLYTLTLPGGQVLRWCGSDVPVTVGANTWVLGPGLARGRLKWSTGITVDTLDVRLYTDGSHTISGTPLIGYVARGGLDNARLQVDRAYRASHSTPVVGVLLGFVGRVADAKPDRTLVQLQVKSDTELLDVMVPREVYEPGCLNTLYDTRCGVSRAARTVSGTATQASNSTRTAFGHSRPEAAGYFDLGVVAFTSGANAGVSRTVKAHVPGTFTLLNPLPFAVAVGDAYEVRPGCDRLKATCSSKFNNLIRFRGYPFIPAPETVT